MRIAVHRAGGIGGYFGGRLARAGAARIPERGKVECRLALGRVTSSGTCPDQGGAVKR